MKRPIRLAVISHGYYPRIGGAEVQLGAVAPALQTLGLDVHILTRRLPGAAAFERVNGVPVHRLPVPGARPVASLVFTLAALSYLARIQPDIIHAHELISPTTTALWAKRLWNLPVVVTVHSSGLQGEINRVRRDVMGTRRLEAARDHVDSFVVISAEIDAELDALGIPPGRRVRIPNGVDTGRFAPVSSQERGLLRARLGLTDGPVAIYAGRLAPEKRLDLLIGAWQQVQTAVPDAQLVLVGSGEDETTLRNLAGGGVRFVGATPDVVGYLQAADLFVLPSPSEGLSVALLEAMATGLPPIAAAVGGNLELISDGINGLLVPPGDGTALGAAILALLNDAGCRKAFGSAARERVVQRFELTVTAKRLCGLYERLLGKC